jgi:hypothetical protein
MLLKFWINAFIPREVPGYTKLISKGPTAGKTAISLPGMARLNPLNTINPFNFLGDNKVFKGPDIGYLTDQRDFDKSFDASSRMQSWIEITVAPHPGIVNSGHRSSGTTEVYIDTGEQRGFDRADMSRCSFTPLRTEPPAIRGGTYRTPLLGIPLSVEYPVSGDPIHKVELSAAAGDPLVSAAADIDYKGTISVQMSATRCHVSFDGFIDDFPAYDCYAQVGGVTKLLFKVPPPKGNSVTDLLGGPSRRVMGRAAFP